MPMQQLVRDTTPQIIRSDGPRAGHLHRQRDGYAGQVVWTSNVVADPRGPRVWRQALDLTVRLTSARSVRYVYDVMRRLRPRADVPAVRDFTAEVRERLPAAAGRAAPR
jgi:hypothetical protein